VAVDGLELRDEPLPVAVDGLELHEEGLVRLDEPLPLAVFRGPLGEILGDGDGRGLYVQGGDLVYADQDAGAVARGLGVVAWELGFGGIDALSERGAASSCPSAPARRRRARG